MMLDKLDRQFTIDMDRPSLREYGTFWSNSCDDTEIRDASISGIMQSDGTVEWYIHIEVGAIEVDGHEGIT